MDTSVDPTLEDDVKEILKEVPAIIRAYFASGKIEIVAKNLMHKYQLHVDQGAVLEREIILLMLGLKNPDEFIQALSEDAALDRQTTNGIIQDINMQIFIPLQEEEKKSATMTTASVPAAPAPVVAPVPPKFAEPVKPAMAAVPPQAKPSAPKGPIPVPAPPQEENQMFMNPTPANPQLPRSPLVMSTGIPASNYVAPRASPVRQSLAEKVSSQYMEGRKMMPRPVPPPAKKAIPVADEKLLEDHEEPHIEFANKALPMNLPGAMPPATTPVRQVTPTSAPKSEQQDSSPHLRLAKQEELPPLSPIPPVPEKPRASDPYREPLDEK